LTSFIYQSPRQFPYQLALTTPGSSPERASSRTQMRHMPNFRR
jgi:hypothetical protein